MSLCDGAHDLLESYGIYVTANNTELNTTITTVDVVFRHWCHHDSVPAIAHYLVGTLLIIICVLSITGNLLVIVVFSRYRRLRSPANTLIVNLATSDMLNGCLHPMAVYSSFNEHWMFGRTGCEVYAGLCGLFGLVSIVTLTAIAIERCLVISVKPWHGGMLFTQAKAKVSCVIVWIYCFVIILPPIFGWGAFVPEGFLTSCSFDYITRTPSNRSYFMYIFILGFFLPVTVISVCYAFIIRTIFQNEKDMKKNNVKKIHIKPRKRNDYKAAEMIMFVIGMFLVSWIPYSVIATIGQFGNRGILTPWLCVLPSLFAKMSTIYNPAIYGLSHRHFRGTLKRIWKKEQRHSAERYGTYLSKNSTVSRTKYNCPCLPSYGASEIFDDSTSSFTGKKVYLGVTVENTVENNKIIYVKNPRPIYEKCRCQSSYGSEDRYQDDILFSPRDSYRHRSSTSYRKQAVVGMHYDSAKISLIRSMMFKSESSIYQKYQVYLEQDRIVKVPSFAYSYVTASRRRKDFSNLPYAGVRYGIPRKYVRVMNLHSLHVEHLFTNVPKNTSSPSENTSSGNTISKHPTKERTYSDTFSQ